MAMPTPASTMPPTSSPRSPNAAPSFAPSSSPARDMATLTRPITSAATSMLMRLVPSAKPTTRLSMLSARPLMSSLPVPQLPGTFGSPASAASGRRCSRSQPTS